MGKAMGLSDLRLASLISDTEGVGLQGTLAPVSS